jgi:2-C-methyl-D-erythritol 4-phosphate cytidylyltransferase
MLTIQFWMVYDRPILYYTLESLEAIEWLEEIVVPVAEDKLAWLEAQLPLWKLHKTRLVVGGEARHRSIFAGVSCLCSCAYVKLCLPCDSTSYTMITPRLVS